MSDSPPVDRTWSWNVAPTDTDRFEALEALTSARFNEITERIIVEDRKARCLALGCSEAEIEAAIRRAAFLANTIP